MLSGLKQRLSQLVEARLDGDLLARIEALKGPLKGRSTDDFGFDPDQLKLAAPVVEFLFRRYFRVITQGMEGLPSGRVLFISNHSGQIPIDAMMVGTALLLEADPPRAARSMIERWVPEIPFVNVLFSRLGQIVGTPENCRALLDDEHAVLVFPEGVRGINKTWDKRYQLQHFGHGFMRLALETNTPIVPVGVIGAEEQYPTLWNLESVAKVLGLPALPIAPQMLIPGLGLLPLPTRYRIYFGAPLNFEGDPDDDDIEIGRKVAVVKDAISSLLDRGRADRESLFF